MDKRTKKIIIFSAISILFFILLVGFSSSGGKGIRLLIFFPLYLAFINLIDSDKSPDIVKKKAAFLAILGTAIAFLF